MPSLSLRMPRPPMPTSGVSKSCGTGLKVAEVQTKGRGGWDFWRRLKGPAEEDTRVFGVEEWRGGGIEGSEERRLSVGVRVRGRDGW
ncbi:hypothetical protein OIU76_019933, partial [Salix suchowensis]